MPTARILPLADAAIAAAWTARGRRVELRQQ
jgi:hypothetical protein